MKLFRTIKYAVFLFVVFNFTSCSNDHEILKSPLLGYYELIEYNSNVEIDLNADGVKTLDLFEELN